MSKVKGNKAKDYGLERSVNTVMVTLDLLEFNDYIIRLILEEWLSFHLDYNVGKKRR